ncbi:MAG: hypothetical protein WC806_04670, partial [Candidatus Gracilibacteria bacterium]
MSEEQVRLVLNLEKRFEKMDVLKGLLVEGKVSVNKLSRIASIAKPENEMFLAGQVQALSKSAVESLVRNEKYWRKEDVKNDVKNEILNVSFENKNENGNANFENEISGKNVERSADDNVDF